MASSIKEEFTKFLSHGNLVQLAVAFVIGAAFAAMVTALVADLVTPLIGVAGKFDFSSWKYTVNGSVFMQGAFLNSVITFVIIAIVIFFLIALPYQRWQDKQAAKVAAVAPTTRACPECLSQIPLAAKRCSFCTSPVTPTA
jgi:large conductance mechanosensitive channel